MNKKISRTKAAAKSKRENYTARLANRQAQFAAKLDAMRAQMEAQPTPFECLCCGDMANERDGFFAMVAQDTGEPVAIVATCRACRASIRVQGAIARVRLIERAKFQLAARDPFIASIIGGGAHA